MNKKQLKLYAEHTHLDADRRLDVAILILLGARALRYSEYGDPDRRDPRYIPSGKPWRTHRIDSQLVPCFSMHWYAAGELQAELERRGYWLDVHTAWRPGEPCHASFDLFGTTDSNPLYTASAPTVPGAIARAAYHVLSGAAWEEGEG